MGKNVLEKLVVFIFWSGQEDLGIVHLLSESAPRQSQTYYVIMQLLSPQYHRKFVCNFNDVHLLAYSMEQSPS
jgi:hypothetical protein